MRLARLSPLVVAFALLAACATTEGTVLSGGRPSSTGSLPPARTLPPEDPALQGCSADWEGFRSLAPLVDRADLIVRARTTSSSTTSEKWGTGYRTTLRVDAVLKGSSAPTISVVESACPVVYGGPADWVLFLSPKPDDAAVYQVPGGIQGAFPITSGRVAPVYRDALLVRTYTDVPVQELERDISAIAPIDADALARLRSDGWSVAGKLAVRTSDLPAASDFGETKIPPRFERPFAGYARIASVTGLDLRPFAGTEYEELAFYLERLPSATTQPPIGHLVYVDRAYVGGWIQVGAEQVFRLDDRARAIAASPRPFTAPTPAPNRYPTGVNVVAEYGLANASAAYVKPLVSGARTPPPQPSVRDLVALLDRTYPTEAAPPRRMEGYWVVGFVLGERYLPFEYHPDSGLLVQRDDGYAIRPPPGLGRLVGAAR